MQGFFSSVGRSIQTLFNTIGWRDYLDIALVAYIVYQLIKLVRQTRAVQLIRGIVILLAVYFFSVQLELKTMTFILRNLLQFGIIALVVVFQPELRRALEQVGRSKISTLSLFSGKSSSVEVAQWNDAIVSLCDSVERMSREKTGALIVIERKTGLSEIVRTGTEIDADTSCELIETIFYEGSPLHDGAIIIRDARIEAAGCILPVSQNLGISKEMGTRHRAALGMSESSDAIIVVVSEETGIISLAQNGIIVRRLDRSNLFRILQGEILPKKEDEDSRQGFIGALERLFKK